MNPTSPDTPAPDTPAPDITASDTHAPDTHAPDLTVDGTGLLCVTLLLRLRKEIEGAPPGTVVHIVATDPAAPLDLPAWCHMTGHHYLGVVRDTVDASVHALRTAADARATRAGAPWHADEPGG
ncbi:sulfurtransferase TusA family protein [Streptomyces sp. NPDC003023]|uniref:sulfurtransferase TusA family protein n=1 Tax=Streptomyces sp. NPDC003023 TaxID=3364675 RepID=UPI0036A01A01